MLAKIGFRSYGDTVLKALDAIGARERLAGEAAILIKPNLINASPPPVTTPVPFCEAVIEYIRSCSGARIVIGEGCGEPLVETGEVFEKLNYHDLARRHEVELVDLNTAPLTRLTNKAFTAFPEIFLPEIAFTHFIISLPVLKAHSLAAITGTLKNMIGLAPPRHYSGGYGVWKKAMFHKEVHQAVIELNRYRSADLSIMDATVGLAEYHLGGAVCDPAPNLILAGYDPWEVDRQAASLLGLDWHEIPHLAEHA